MSDEDEIIRSTGAKGTARVEEGESGAIAKRAEQLASQTGSRKANDVRISYSAVRKVPLEDPKKRDPQSAQVTGAASTEALTPQRVAIIYKRKAKHVFADRLVSIISETQVMRSRLESLPKSM